MKDWVAIGIHGMGGHHTRFGPLAAYYQAHGINTVTFDLMGFGKSTLKNRGDIDSFSDYVSEVTLLCAEIRAKKPGARIVLVGENIGGLIAALTAIEKPGSVDALVLLNPQLDARKPFDRKTSWFLSFCGIFMPGRHFELPMPDENQCDDEKWCRMLEEDPQEIHEITARFWWAMVRATIEVNAGLGRIKQPTLIQLSASKATMTNPEASRAFFRRIPADMKHLQDFEVPEEMILCKERDVIFEKQIHFIQSL